jgi:hypothetical protein
MSFFKSLFSRRPADEPAAPKPVKTLDHNGFHIRAEPFPAEGQYQTAGVIEKEIDGVRKEHRFIRADRFSSLEETAEFSLTKGRQIVDEQGDRLFK